MRTPHSLDARTTRPLDAEAAPTAPVLAFNTDGSRIPLIFVRTWFNEVRTYETLARHLGADQPLYTIAPPQGTTRADMPPTAEVWAEFCLERLTDIPHDGPYIVGGWSFGGVVALELARTLQARGADVRRVLFIDTWMPHHRAVRRGFFGQLVLHVNRMIELDPAARHHYVRKRVKKKVAQLRARWRLDRTPRERDPYGVDHIVTNRGTEMSLLRRAVWVAHYKYRGGRTTLPVSLYCSTGSRDAKNDIALGWLPSLRGEFESLSIPGEHFTIFEEPHVATLAARIARTVAACAPERRNAIRPTRRSSVAFDSHGSAFNSRRAKEDAMIDLYTWTTPNGHKVPIMLEETRLEYTVHPVDLSKGEQKKPEFLALNPNGKIPAIVDHDGPGGKRVAVFESGAILIYLAEKTGKFLPREGERRAQVLEWLMFQMSAVGPMLGQLYYFAVQMPDKLPPAIEHFRTEGARIFDVLDGQLGRAEFLAGDYSIADMATYPWVSAALESPLGAALGERPNVKRWAGELATRPAVQRGMKVPS